MSAQYKKEIRSYACNMTGAVFTVLVLVLTAIYATAYNFKGGYPSFEYALSGVTFILFLAVPILTMKSFAEERSQKTDQLLYSLPLGMTRIVIGKYLAMITVFGVSVAVMCLYPIILSMYGSVNFVSAYSAIFGFFLLGCALIAIGMFISTLTESQVIAAVITFGAFILLYLLRSLAAFIPTTASASLWCFILLAVIIGIIIYSLLKNSVVATGVSALMIVASAVVYFVNSELFEGLFPDMLEKLALFDRLSAFTSQGIFDISGAVYYLTAICLFVYFTVRSMEKRRWA